MLHKVRRAFASERGHSEGTKGSQSHGRRKKIEDTLKRPTGQTKQARSVTCDALLISFLPTKEMRQPKNGKQATLLGFFQKGGSSKKESLQTADVSVDEAVSAPSQADTAISDTPSSEANELFSEPMDVSDDDDEPVHKVRRVATIGRPVVDSASASTEKKKTLIYSL